MNDPWHFQVMAVMYVFAGIMHFVKPIVYQRVMPQFLPAHKALVYLSGIAEIVLGIALFIPVIKTIAIYGIITMLISFFLVHFNMLRGEKEAAGIPKWILVLRIPLQFGLIYWAWQYL